VYWNHATLGTGPDPVQWQRSTQDLQLVAIQAIAQRMSSALHLSFLIGDLNIWLGEFQERLRHPLAMQAGSRKSKHKPLGSMSYETKRAIDIFQNHDLLILNGRYGTNSAETTFQTNVSTETTIDYALCHQSFFPRVTNMAVCKNNLAGIASDHFPIILSAQCEGTDPEVGGRDPGTPRHVSIRLAHRRPRKNKPYRQIPKISCGEFGSTPQRSPLPSEGVGPSPNSETKPIASTSTVAVEPPPPVDTNPP
jgi:hypothetical protein